LRLNVLPRGKATVSRAGIKFKNLLYGSKRAIEEQWYTKLKNKSVSIVYDPRHLDRIYIPNDDGLDYETCILLEPSEQYKTDFLEDIVFHQQLRNELEEEERSKQVQLTINTDTMMEQIIKTAKEKKKNTLYKPTSKKEKLDAIRDNKENEKQINREEEKFDLSPPVKDEDAEIIDFATRKKIEEQPVKKGTSRLMEKLKRKRDEELGKDK